MDIGYCDAFLSPNVPKTDHFPDPKSAIQHAVIFFLIQIILAPIITLAILLSAFYWVKTSKNDANLPIIYAFALACTFLGAKVAYLFAEGWLYGCCLGIASNLPGGFARWPAVQTEVIFNLAAILLFIWMRKQKLQTYQHFHVYLIGYSIFRFFHEFLRATPKRSSIYRATKSFQ